MPERSQHTQGKPSQAAPPVGLGRGPGRHGMPSFEKANDRRGTLLRLWGYLRRQQFTLLLVVGLVALSTGFHVAGPFLMGRAIDVYILQHDAAGLARIALLLVAVYVLNAALTWLQIYVMSGVSQRTVRDLRRELFDKLQTLSLRFFDQHPHGELMSRLSNDIENISRILSEGTTQFISSVFTIIGVTIVMLRLNAWLALVTMIAVPVMGGIVRWISARTRQGYRERQRTLGVLNGLVEETVTGERVVKAYGREQDAIQQFEDANAAFRAAAIKADLYGRIMGPLANVVNNINFAIVACVGGFMTLNGWATVGTVASFLSYSRQFSMPLNQIAMLYNLIQSALAGAERVFDILDEAPEITDAPDAKALQKVQGKVVFEHVDFAYTPDVPVLKDVSLRAEPGQMIALVGPTGAGKTTIVNVLTRFYDIDHGDIQIDGHDLRRLKKADLRRTLGIVLQDTFLFSASVMENIRYGRLDATDEEVIAAAKLAEADHFIHHLPQGYATTLAERGSNLSQGQRQLLAIARAVLADPGILILDEATSSVDTRTEIHIQHALLRLMRGRTSFVIAHRLSTIRNADQVLVINNGQIIERGTHPELLAQRGFYHNLYMSQFKGHGMPVSTK